MAQANAYPLLGFNGSKMLIAWQVITTFGSDSRSRVRTGTQSEFENNGEYGCHGTVPSGQRARDEKLELHLGITGWKMAGGAVRDVGMPCFIQTKCCLSPVVWR
uniref:Uncharacterized protein n=1 Tax=Melanopsichium pennsylvanicum 4 TaxID=1398559 RepID=A0A077R1Y3_9BASI|nr:uncharacterized protein BN887_06077 [Melanopsichium pennsylvanicum 4]